MIDLFEKCSKPKLCLLYTSLRPDAPFVRLAFSKPPVISFSRSNNSINSVCGGYKLCSLCAPQAEAPAAQNFILHLRAQNSTRSFK